MKAQNQMKKIIAIASVALGLAAVAAPKVKIDKIENTSVWTTKKVTYTVSDVPASDGLYDYTLAFDVTAYGVTTNISKGAAQNGTFTEVLNTAVIFGETRKDPNAKIRVSVEKVEPWSVQLWENGPHFARCNVGATRPEEYGYYFWWGDTVGYKRNGSRWDAVDGSKTGYSFEGGNCPTWWKDNDTLKALGYIDDVANPVLNATHDAATVHLGAPWRMMTDAEQQKLVDTAVCKWEWKENYNGAGVNGCLVTGATPGYEDKSIFLPAAGIGTSSSSSISIFNVGGCGSYWASSPYSGASSTPSFNATNSAWEVSISRSSFGQSGGSRFSGCSVRPVR